MYRRAHRQRGSPLLCRLGAKEHRLRHEEDGGEVGYLHIPDMGRPVLDEFTKLYFPQIRKHALIVDVRGNGGGFVSPLVIERLRARS